MSLEILKCQSCAAYGLSVTCACGSARIPVLPPKFSPEDRWGAYRRKYKELHPRG